MEQVAKLISHLSPTTAGSKIKFGLSSIFIYKTVRDKLLEDEGEEEEEEIKSSLRVDNIIGPLAPVMKFYQIITTLAHIINFFITSASIYYEQSKVTKDNKDNNTDHTPAILCHLPRFVVHPIIGPHYMAWLGCTFSLLQLGWRSWVLFKQRLLKQDTFTYLLLDDKVFQANSDPNLALRSYINQHKLNLAQRLMFYKVEAESYSDVAIGLRPNRTPEARERLLNIVHMSFYASNIIFISMNLFFISLTLWTAVYQIDFFYPGCEQSNFLLGSANKRIGSTLLSAIILIDSFAAYLYAFFLDFIIIGDLKIYWSRIELEMKELHRLICDHRQLCDQLLTTEVVEKGMYSLGHRKLINSLGHRRLINSLKIFDQSHFISSQQQKRKQRLSIEISEIGSLSCLADHNSTFDLRHRIYVFQTVMCDFFEKLSEIDGYMSLALAMTFLIWLSTNGVVSYIGLQTDTSASSLLIRLVQFFMLLIYALFSAIILNLKQSIDPAYNILSSIMAYDPSLEKNRWLYLLKYYTVMPRHSFTIFHSSVFSSLIFFQSFSYTITYSIYMYNLRAQTPDT